MKAKVTLVVEGTAYVPVRAVELQRLRAVEKAALAAIKAKKAEPALRKLAQAVR